MNGDNYFIRRGFEGIVVSFDGVERNPEQWIMYVRENNGAIRGIDARYSSGVCSRENDRREADRIVRMTESVLFDKHFK